MTTKELVSWIVEQQHTHDATANVNSTTQSPDTQMMPPPMSTHSMPSTTPSNNGTANGIHMYTIHNSGTGSTSASQGRDHKTPQSTDTRAPDTAGPSNEQESQIYDGRRNTQDTDF